MTNSAWTVATLVTLLFVILFALTYSQRYLAGRAVAFSRSVGLALPAELAGSVRARIARRQRGAVIGGLVAGGACVAALGAQLGGTNDLFATFLLIGSVFAGVSIGVAVASIGFRRRHTTDAVKFARSGAVELRDYLAPIELTGARLAVALAVVASITLAVTDASALNLIIVAITIAAVASLVFFEIAGRRIVGSAQPAESPAELAWDDAIRATVLRDVVTGPLTLGVYAFVLCAGGMVVALTLSLDSRVGSLIGGLFFFVAIGLGIVMVIVSMVTKPQRHFLRRLWPAVAAGRS